MSSNVTIYKAMKQGKMSSNVTIYKAMKQGKVSSNVTIHYWERFQKIAG